LDENSSRGSKQWGTVSSLILTFSEELEPAVLLFRTFNIGTGGSIIKKTGTCGFSECELGLGKKKPRTGSSLFVNYYHKRTKPEQMVLYKLK
jgi:hypothetical protein